MSLKDEEAMKLLKEIRSEQKALGDQLKELEDKLGVLKEEITEAVEDLSKDLLKLSVFCHDILEVNQRTIYAKITGQEEEEDKEEEEET